MVISGKHLERIEFLARSETRVQILELLNEETTLEKRELRNHFGVARTTLQRNLDALVDQGWIQKTSHDQYSINQSGQLVLSDLTRLIDTVEFAARVRPLVEFVPDELDLNLSHFTDESVDICVPTRSNPYAPVEEHMRLLRDSGSFRCILPAVGVQPLHVAHESVVDRGQIHEVIIDTGVAETFVSHPDYSAPIEQMVDTVNFHIFVYEGDFEFYLGLSEDTVQIGFQDESGLPRGLLECSSESAYEWAESTYQRFKGQARSWRAFEPSERPNTRVPE